MSDPLLASDIIRARRIHELERVADDQREQLRTSAMELAAGIRDAEVVRQISRGLAEGRTLAQRFTGGAAWWREIFGRHPTPAGGTRPFPWPSALAAAGGIWQVIRWWRHRRD